MFVQIIEGHTDDAAGFRRQAERWRDDLKADAPGFLGSTGGVTDDGRVVLFARFASEDEARRNSDRPEQGDWWTETEKYFDGEPAFTETTDCQEFLGGGSDDAGFVQVMKSSGVDRDAMARLDAEFEKFSGHRPDLLGVFRAWTGPGEAYDVAYFTSEEAARKGEQSEPPPELAELMGGLQDAMGETVWFDLKDPLLF